MRVRATKLGYHGHFRRNPGDEFELVEHDGHMKEPDGKLTKRKFTAEDQFSEHWMEKVGEADEKPKKRKDESRAPQALSKLKNKDVI